MGEVICTVGGMVSGVGVGTTGALTVTTDDAEPVLEAGSTATTDKVWEPDIVPVFQLKLNEALVEDATSTPSQYKLTLFTPRLSTTDPFTATVPLTVVPEEGEEIVTAGG